MKNLLVFATIVSAMVQVNQAQACSYLVNQIQKKNILVAETATHLVVELMQVDKSEISEFSWFESKPTPMCPEEITYEGKVTLTYQDLTAFVPTTCISSVYSTLKENSKSKESEYTFSNITTVCIPNKN